MKKTFLQICLFLIATTSFAQTVTDTLFAFNKRFSILELKKDLSVLRDSLEIVHPALYRYTSKHSFDSAFNLAYKQINRPLTQAEFYGIVAPLISKVGDIHTTIEPSDESFRYLATKSDLFPFDVRIINKKVFIASNNSSVSSIEVGSRIIRINNQSIDKVLNKMETYFSDEGRNETLKLKRVEQRFAFQYHLTYGYFKVFKLEYLTDKGILKIKSINAQPFNVIKENRTKNQVKYPNLKSLFPQSPYLSFSIDLEKNMAALNIKWFQNDVLQSSNEVFKSFIDSAFSEIKSNRIENLIVDIRNNGGGESENASYLYSYLTNKPFRFLYAMETNRKTYLEDKKRGIKYTIVENTGKYQTIDSSTSYQQYFGLGYQRPAINNFSGKLYVLIDGLTTSAAPQFASLVKLNKRGVFIGETAPGSLYGGSGRGYSYFYLPNSGLLTMISEYRLFLANPTQKNKDDCIMADYKPKKSFWDTLNGIDKDIEYARRLITNTK
jgi:C-terminal processing protease CtpA/Prc